MKTTLLVATIALGLGAHAAFAAEGAGDPFPFRAPGVTHEMSGFKQAPGASDDPYPMKNPGHVVTQAENDALLPANGAEGMPQSVNSLPKGFANGMASYAQLRPASPTAVAQATGVSRTHG